MKSAIESSESTSAYPVRRPAGASAAAAPSSSSSSKRAPARPFLRLTFLAPSSSSLSARPPCQIRSALSQRHKRHKTKATQLFASHPGRVVAESGVEARSMGSAVWRVVKVRGVGRCGECRRGRVEVSGDVHEFVFKFGPCGAHQGTGHGEKACRLSHTQDEARPGVGVFICMCVCG